MVTEAKKSQSSSVHVRASSLCTEVNTLLSPRSVVRILTISRHSAADMTVAHILIDVRESVALDQYVVLKLVLYAEWR